MKKYFLLLAMICSSSQCFCWGFYAHRKINNCSVFLLPPQMLGFYKKNIEFITEHSTDPDKRRYAVADEGSRHYIDLDNYGEYPFRELPRNWNEAVAKFGEDSLKSNGIVPWHVQTVFNRLTNAFKEKNYVSILKNSAELGHYISDAHVPLHASSNHNGQKTDQKGIHAFWESRVPELLAEKEFDFFIGKASYIKDPQQFIWDRVLESALAADSVLKFEKELSARFPSDKKYAFEKRNNTLIRQYSSDYSKAYHKKLDGMIERRMRQSIFAIASFWYSAWINAGQPDLGKLSKASFSENDQKEFEELNEKWRKGGILGREDEG